VSQDEDAIADLIALVVSGRQDAFVDVAVGDAAPVVNPQLRAVRETLGLVALAEPPCEPSAGLRARILQTLDARSVQQRRAILVVDMQNDHLEPGGPLEVPRARAIVPALATRLEAARRDGVPVVYVVDEHTPDDSDLDAWGSHNVKGTGGARIWPALAPQPDEIVVPKATYSAFTGSELASALHRLRVDTLVLTGCLTEVGLLTTATDALQRGYAIEIPPDSQAGATELNEQVALGVIGLLPPYGPAREALLATVRSGAARPV
jgi:nicotinamidase-related amidase